MRYDRIDGRNPYGSRGGYVVSSRGRGRGRGRGDRGMDYGMRDMRGDYEDMARGGDYGDMARGRMDYGYSPDMGQRYDMARDMRSGYDMGSYDGHYGRQGGYEPVEAMGYFTGYYGSPQDYGRGYGRGRDYGYDMRGRMDYGDFGEVLTEEELEQWCKRLKNELTEQEKQMFSKENIMQRARAMGKQMQGFGEKELEVATLMCYTDYKGTIGQSVDMAIKLAFDWLTDKDVAVKGAEKLAVYYDCIVMGD